MATFATVNLKHTLTNRETRADIRRVVRARAHVIGWQELGGKSRGFLVRRELRRLGYRLVRRSFKPGQAAVPVAYQRCRFRLVKARSWFLTPSTKVGQRGAGPKRLKRKYATWVLLRDRVTGELFAVANAHLAPSIHIPIRGRLHDQQIRRLAALARHIARKHPNAHRVFVGDYNTTDLRRLAPLARAGLRVVTSPAPTKGNRSIDYILTDAPVRLVGDGQVLGDCYTDHRPYLVPIGR